MQQVASESCNFHVNLRGMSQRSNSRRKQCATEQASWNHTNFWKSQTMYYIYNYVYIYIYIYVHEHVIFYNRYDKYMCVCFFLHMAASLHLNFPGLGCQTCETGSIQWRAPATNTDEHLPSIRVPSDAGVPVAFSFQRYLHQIHATTL